MGASPLLRHPVCLTKETSTPDILRIRNEMRNGKSIFDLPLRVTFYARVSTGKDEQLNSLENQVQY